MTAPSRTIALWCPDWPVTAAIRAGEVAADPELPIGIFCANRVVACSAAARAEGVRRDLRRREAQGRCPSLVVLAHDSDRDARFFEPVVAAVESSAPGVEVVRPGMVAVGARGPTRYYGGDAATVAHLRGEIHRRCDVPALAGVADGLLAALVAARQSYQSGSGAPTFVAPGRSAEFLAGQSIEALHRSELTDLLGRLGIRTLGAFAALPAHDVADRFGADGADAHRLARGLDLRPLAARALAPELITRTIFDPPVQRVDAAAFAAKALADEFHDRLTGRGLGCLRLSIIAHTSRGDELVRLWRHEGTLGAKAIADRVRWQLDGWLTATAAANPEDSTDTDSVDGIADLALVPDQVVPYAGAQLRLWDRAAGAVTDWRTETEAAERADRALTRVQGLLGPAGVVTAVSDGGRGPAGTMRLVPWGDPRVPARIPARAGADRAGVTPPWPGRIPPPSPATVLAHPALAAVTDRDGQPIVVGGRLTLSAPPSRLDDEVILAWSGPWPIDERWWDTTTARRCARFQMVTADGTARLLVVEGGYWWIEAVYD